MEITIHLAIGRDKFNDFFEKIGFTYNNHGEVSDLDKYLELNEEIVDILINRFEDYYESFFLSKESFYIHFQTPIGKRVLYQPGMKYIMHNHIGGYTPSQDLIGIGLVGKIFPSFLDWELDLNELDKSGILILNQKSLDIISHIKENLVAINPIFDIFDIVIKNDE